MNKLFKIYELQITPFTPIHVGSGEELNPGEYFVFDDDSNQPVLYATDIGYLGSRLAPEDREELIRLISENPIEWVKKASESKIFKNWVRKYARLQAGMTKRVAGNIRDRWGEAKSRLGVHTMQRSGQDAIIPGSSIKGAIRTALLWSATREPMECFPASDFKVAKWERRCLGASSERIQDDPLRWLKVSDAVASGVRTWILDSQHVGMKTKSGEEAELQDYRECLPDSTLAGKDYVITARLSIEVGHPGFAGFSSLLSADHILESCCEFYRQVIQSEREYWKGDSELLQVYDDLEQHKDGVPIRIGWGSGMNAVSLNLAKPPAALPVADPTTTSAKKNVITRRLLDGMPPGWALIRLVEV